MPFLGAISKYVTIYSNPDTSIFEKRIEFGKIKSQFYDYVVNVPVDRGQTGIPFDSDKEFGFYVVELNSNSPFYSYSETDFSINTGYQSVQTINL